MARKFLIYLTVVSFSIVSVLFCVELILQVYKSSLVRKNITAASLGNKTVILSLGESTTYGLYVPAEKNYSSFLEKRLSEKNGDNQYVVLNLGYPAALSEDIYSCLKEALDTVSPTLVLANIGHNDFSPNMNYRQRGLPKPSMPQHPFAFGKLAKPKWFKEILLLKIFNYYMRRIGIIKPWSVFLDKFGNPRMFYYEHGSMKAFTEEEKKAVAEQLKLNILLMKKLCLQKGIDFVLVGYFHSESNDYLRAWSRDYGIFYVDNSMPDEGKRAKLVLGRNPYGMIDDFHPNERGQEVMMENILATLADMGFPSGKIDASEEKQH